MNQAGWVRALRTGAGITQDWGGISRLTAGLLSSGCADGWVREELMDPENVGAQFINYSTSTGEMRPLSVRRKKSQRAVTVQRRWLDNHPPAKDRGEAIVKLASLRDAVHEHVEVFTGTAGATDQRVLLALVEIAMRPGKLTFDASTYDVGVIAGCSQQTASRSIRRLIEAGYVRCIEVGAGRRASTYCLTSHDLSHTVLPLRGERCDSPDGGPAGHDAFRSGVGLGRRTGQAYELLGAEPLPREHVAELMGLKPRSVIPHLQRLRAFDLARYVAHDGWVIGDGDLDEIARSLGLDGARDRQKEALRVRREHRNDYLNRHQVSHKDSANPPEGDDNEEVPTSEAEAVTIRRLMAWVRLRKSFTREYMEMIADRHGEAALYALARDLEGVA